MMSKATNEKRWARAALSMWALGLCAFLGIFLFVAVESVFEVRLVRGNKPLVGVLFRSWVVLIALRVFAFSMVRRATGAAAPSLIAILSLVPLLSLVVNGMIMQQAMRDLDDRGYSTGISTSNFWAWASPYVITAILWILVASRFDLHGFVLTCLASSIFVVPVLLRLRIALKLRSAIHAWELSTTTVTPRAHGSSPAAG